MFAWEIGGARFLLIVPGLAKTCFDNNVGMCLYGRFEGKVCSDDESMPKLVTIQFWPGMFWGVYQEPPNPQHPEYHQLMCMKINVGPISGQIFEFVA